MNKFFCGKVRISIACKSTYIYIYSHESHLIEGKTWKFGLKTFCKIKKKLIKSKNYQFFIHSFV